MYILKEKIKEKNVYKVFYSKPIKPYYIAYNFYNDGHLYMNQDEYTEYLQERDNPELNGIDDGDFCVTQWCDVSSNNEFEIVSKFVADCILQGKNIEYDTPLFVELHCT